MKPTYKALLIDLSGVLYVGDEPIPEAVTTLEKLRSMDLVLRFVTNTATQNHQNIITKLHKMGYKIDSQELFTAPIAAKQYIKANNLRPFCLIHEALKEDFSELDQHQPNCILLGDAREQLNYRTLNKAFQLCMAGSLLIGIGKNKYFKDKQGLMLDAGAFIHALEWAANTQAIIMGKPSYTFFTQAVRSTTFSPKECLMIGDDVESDVIGAMNAGLGGCLVRSGKYQVGDDKKLPATAHIIDSFSRLMSML
ncbi:TIGR01458 family HAD-type hydrolase [Zooshikella harenae]|uniref:Haloacid dehalogenase-like hydrolase domain-containing protein 2 n=1 Tax=Zooshikella harenae TaxID=2827238 RepID=A0ABS5Z9R0_9GAMM|nr:TIGR01458 family HAD-type hydrolase [Zooshikella harenae]MBU2710493.1 TIGR01458 family HAD-type hydrolase [Zooshikella harenae]